jgi:hypothetical protein
MAILRFAGGDSYNLRTGDDQLWGACLFYA